MVEWGRAINQDDSTETVFGARRTTRSDAIHKSSRTPCNLALAFSERSVDFSKISPLTEEMVDLLPAAKVNDDDKNERCEAKVLAHQIAGHKDATEDELSNAVSQWTFRDNCDGTLK